MQRILGVLTSGVFAMLAAGSDAARATDDCEILKQAHWKNSKVIDDLGPFIGRLKSQVAEALDKYDEKRRRADETKSFSDLNYATIAHLEFQRLKKELAQTEARYEKEMGLGSGIYDALKGQNCLDELPSDMQHLAGTLSDDYRKALREEQRSDPASYNKRIARLREQANMPPLSPPTSAPPPPPPKARAPKAAAAPSPLDEVYKAPNINDCEGLRKQLAQWEFLTAGATERLTQNQRELLENKRWLVRLWGKQDADRDPDSVKTYGEQRSEAQSEISYLEGEISRVSKKLDEARSSVSDLRMLISASPDCDKDKPRRPERQASGGPNPATSTAQPGSGEVIPDLPANIIELIRKLRETDPTGADQLERELRDAKRREAADQKREAEAKKREADEQQKKREAAEQEKKRQAAEEQKRREASVKPAASPAPASGNSCPAGQVRMWCGNTAVYNEDCYEASVAQQKAKEHLEKNKNSDCQINGKYVEKPSTTPSPAVLPPVALKAAVAPAVLPPLVLPPPQVASAPEPMLHTPPQPPPEQHSVPQPPKEQKQQSKRPQPRHRVNPGPSQAQAQAQQEAAAAATAIAIIGAVAAGVAASSSGPSYHRPAAPAPRAPAPRHH